MSPSLSHREALLGRGPTPQYRDAEPDEGLGPETQAGRDRELSSAGPRLRVLLLCDYDEQSAGTIRDHIRSFVEYSRHQYVIRSGRGDLLAGVDLSGYDALVVHYSLVACYDAYLAPPTRRKIRAFRGLKAAFVQDDYRFIDRTVEAFAYLRINALFPLAGPSIIDEVYSPAKLPGVRKVTVLAGYVPEQLATIEVPRYAERPIDVGYRARKLPAWMGSHTLQKWQISERFAADAVRYGLKVDLSCREEDRIYGDDWIRFVTRCKSMLGTESGASVCDFTGKIQENVERHLEHHPNTSFEELRERYFKDEDGRLMMNVISPRCFEAAALRTLMVMYEGEYSGVLEPWRHYVPLKPDHSNMKEVVSILRDDRRAEEIIDRAYRDLILSGRYSYRTMVATIDRVFDECLMPEMLAANRRDPVSPGEPPIPLALPTVVASPGMAAPTPRGPGPIRVAYRRFRELARRASPMPVWALLQAVKRRSSQFRDVFARLRRVPGADLALARFGLLSGGSESMRTLPLLDEIARLRALLAFFAAHRDAAVVLELDSASGDVWLIGVPLAPTVMPGHGTEVAEQDARRILLEKRARRISWSNRDPLGLGCTAPFEAEFVFEQLGVLAKTRPAEVARLLLPGNGMLPYRRIVLTSPSHPA